MNDIINKFLLAGDKFMPEMHLRQLGLLIVLVDPKGKERIQKWITKFIFLQKWIR